MAQDNATSYEQYPAAPAEEQQPDAPKTVDDIAVLRQQVEVLEQAERKAAKAKKEAAKAKKEAERKAAKAKKEAATQAAKAKKEAATQAAKAKKEAERKAAKAKKEAETQAAKAKKEAETQAAKAEAQAAKAEAQAAKIRAAERKAQANGLASMHEELKWVCNFRETHQGRLPMLVDKLRAENGVYYKRLRNAEKVVAEMTDKIDATNARMAAWKSNNDTSKWRREANGKWQRDADNVPAENIERSNNLLDQLHQFKPQSIQENQNDGNIADTQENSEKHRLNSRPGWIVIEQPQSIQENQNDGNIADTQENSKKHRLDSNNLLDQLDQFEPQSIEENQNDGNIADTQGNSKKHRSDSDLEWMLLEPQTPNTGFSIY